MTASHQQLGLSDVSNLFRQYFLQNQCVEQTKLAILIESYRKKSSSRLDLNLDSLVEQSNRIFRNYGFSIKMMKDLNTGEMYYILINEIMDSLSIQHVWSPYENNLYYSLVKEIIENLFQNINNDNMEGDLDEQLSIKMTTAVNLSRGTKITMTVGEKIIKNWINEHWFKLTDSKKITLGIRTLAQNSAYLTESYALVACNLCNLICLKGYQCSRCDIVFHDYCSAPNLHCSNCNSPMQLVEKILPK